MPISSIEKSTLQADVAAATRDVNALRKLTSSDKNVVLRDLTLLKAHVDALVVDTAAPTPTPTPAPSPIVVDWKPI